MGNLGSVGRELHPAYCSWKEAALESWAETSSVWGSGTIQACPSWARGCLLRTPSSGQISDLPLPDCYLSISALQPNVTHSHCPPSSHRAPSALEFLFLWAAFGEADWLKAVILEIDSEWPTRSLVPTEGLEKLFSFFFKEKEATCFRTLAASTVWQRYPQQPALLQSFWSICLQSC